jgi:superfamily I DNA and/or RNA helicase
MVERRVLGAWLDWVYQQEQVLEGFTSPEQADLIAKFKELDEQLVLAAQFQVRRKIFERYPDIYATSGRTNELGMLRGELSKRRMRAPVRKLFRTIPRLIQTLKPCFLVSPLAVSQYLPFSELSSETLNFDVVIFDEASQVFPEDAIPAVLRGKQLVLAGDQKQLPPSSFFKRSPAEDEAGYDDDGADDQSNQLVGRESILDVAVGLVGRLFNEAHLNVHYRSRDESLIGFSNHHFYGDQLLTFPSPGLRDSWYGVHDVYVPDGRYDAGATRTNRKEAEQIVELVFQHMRTRPAGESLGVVALSRAQADLIDRLIEERRILERDVDERFAERPDEPFFVKNT